MKTLKSISLFLLFMPLVLMGQKIDNTISFRDIKSDNYIRLHHDNDVFYQTDKDYTQGINIELVSSWLTKNPINHIFISPKNSEFKYGVASEHISFTPDSIESFEIEYGDRPFAAAFMLKSFIIATDTINKSRLSSSLSIGIIGPGAFGDVQRRLHKIIGSGYPNGWYYQIKNDVIINYDVSYEKELLRLNNFFSINGTAGLKLGTLFTNASVGLNASLGIINSPFTSVKNKNKFELYLYTQPIVSIVGYDATLQGGLINDKSPYTILSRDLERYSAQNNLGIVLQTGRFYFEYTLTLQTRETSITNPHKWGGFRLGYKL